MENQETAQVATENGVGGTAAPKQPELSINDLLNIRAVIDTAVRRGAFGGAEASSVGVVFDRLNTFLNAVAPKPATTETDTQETATA
jgi:hypothetical protein